MDIYFKISMNTSSVVTGDFNIDYHHILHSNAKKLDEIAHTYGLTQTINLPTSGVEIVGIADHLFN